MSVIIQNPSLDVCALPYPFRGVLRGRQQVKLNMTMAQALVALGGAVPAGALLLSEGSDAAPYDDAYLGDAVYGDGINSRQPYGPFVRTDLAASLSDSRLGIGATAAPNVDAAVGTTSSLTRIVATLTVAPAGGNLVLKVFKNGTLLNAAAILTIVPGAGLVYSVTFARGTYPLLATDKVGIAVDTAAGWTATTSDLTAWLGVTTP